MIRPAFDVAQLSIEEHLELIDTLWDSLRRQARALPLSAAERALVAERSAEHARNPDDAVPWETIRDELLADQAMDERSRRGG